MPRKETFRNPHNLPSKLCPVCGRPFTWRKKWARDWDSVVYCSDKCRKTRPGTRTDPPEAGR